MPGPPATKLDGMQVLRHAFEDATGRIRTDATLSPSDVQVEIDAADGDNIAISDGVDTLAINPDGSINASLTGTINIEVDAADGDNVAISDGTNTLDIQPDGSINVNLVQPGSIISQYSEITSVAAAILSTILTYTVPAATTSYLQSVSVAGTNIAIYDIKLNATIIDKKYTYFAGGLNVEFIFSDQNRKGVTLVAGDVITVNVLHNRPTVGDFNARLQTIEV